MPKLRVYGFTDDIGRLALQSALEPIGGQALNVVSNGMLHALVGFESSPWPWSDKGTHSLSRLVAYNRVLGECTRVLEKIIPASFESVFDNVEAVQKALAQHQRDILDLMARYGDMRQFALTVRWDTIAMQQLFQRHGYKESALEQERRLLRDQTLATLQGYLQDLIIVENNESDVVLQAVLLVKRDGEAKLVNQLHKLDEECHGRLAMRLIGPMPACNFARIELRLPDFDTVKTACRDLGIGRATRLIDIKTAYRQRVKNLHPDRAQNDNNANNSHMVRLTQSYRYLTRLAEQQNSGLQINPDKQWLRVDTKNLRQTPLMRIQRGLTRWDDAVMKRH